MEDRVAKLEETLIDVRIELGKLTDLSTRMVKAVETLVNIETSVGLIHKSMEMQDQDIKHMEEKFRLIYESKEKMLEHRLKDLEDFKKLVSDEELIDNMQQLVVYKPILKWFKYIAVGVSFIAVAGVTQLINSFVDKTYSNIESRQDNVLDSTTTYVPKPTVPHLGVK